MNNLHRKILLEMVGLTEEELEITGGPKWFWDRIDLNHALDDGLVDGLIEEIQMEVEEWREETKCTAS